MQLQLQDRSRASNKVICVALISGLREGAG